MDPLKYHRIIRLTESAQNAPALPSHNVSNTVIWILAFAPLIGFMLEAFIAGATTVDEDAAMETLFSGQFWYITLLLNIALSYWDERNLKKEGSIPQATGNSPGLFPSISGNAPKP